MHGFAFGAARFVDDALEKATHGGVGERAGIDALGVLQDFALALRLIQRKIFGFLDFADFQRTAGTLVEQLDELAVDFIDLATPVAESHGATSRRERPCVAACFSERTRAARAVPAASTDFAFSISETSAEPTTAASARPPRMETWPGSEIPNPTAMGSGVTARARRTNCGRSSGRVSLAPVTPVLEMRYKKPLEDSAICFRRASVEVGAARKMVSRPRWRSAWRYSPASSGARSVTSVPSAPAAAAASAKRSSPICSTGLK